MKDFSVSINEHEVFLILVALREARLETARRNERHIEKEYLDLIQKLESQT